MVESKFHDKFFQTIRQPYVFVSWQQAMPRGHHSRDETKAPKNWEISTIKSFARHTTETGPKREKKAEGGTKKWLFLPFCQNLTGYFCISKLRTKVNVFGRKFNILRKIIEYEVRCSLQTKNLVKVAIQIDRWVLFTKAST